jgi:GntR family transcriptional regulator
MAEAIYARVARAIRDGLGPAGSSLPSETDLMLQHHVTRGTVRRALALLESQGLVLSSQGKPRTVRGSKRWRWNMTEWELKHKSYDADAWGHSISEQGGEPRSEIQIASELVPDQVAPLLAVEPGTAILARHRLRFVDGEPHQLSDSYFPPWVTEQAIWWQPGDMAAPGGLLAATGHAQSRWLDAITSGMPSTEETDQLRMAPGTPLITHTRIGYDSDDRPVRVMITRMAADRVEITYDVQVKK